MVTNEDVYRRMNIKQSLRVVSVRRQMSLLGHVLRAEEIEHLVVTVLLMANVLVADNGKHFSPTSADLRTNHQWNCYD